MNFKAVAQRATTVAAVVAFGAMLCSCGGRKPSWRTYKEHEVIVQAPHAAHAAGEAAAAPAGAESQAALQWKTPQGWSETRSDSGMRLATFELKGDAGAGTCTIVLLGGDAGGLKANVVRWIGQLQLAVPADPDFDAFMKRQQTFATEGGFNTVLLDLTELGPANNDAANSMLASYITVGESSCFVKLTGPAGLLKKEKENFIQLCRSLKK